MMQGRVMQVCQAPVTLGGQGHSEAVTTVNPAKPPASTHTAVCKLNYDKPRPRYRVREYTHVSLRSSIKSLLSFLIVLILRYLSCRTWKCDCIVPYTIRDNLCWLQIFNNFAIKWTGFYSNYLVNRIKIHCLKTPTSRSCKVALSTYEILVGAFILLTVYPSYMFCFSSFECCVLEPEGDKPL